ncbi:MAG: trimethylamine methyltransferase family protein [Hyphomicrobiales bacterium]|nr:trimethylamine methyltransferase family protein [Hyphomicrobiales bacterium]MBV8443834.1 trimethylamine methyltransferase family protein [Hyphomicrobiales bacterium]
MDLIGSIPSHITYRARNPSKNVELGGPHAIFVPMTGAPYPRDLCSARPHVSRLGNFS